MKNSGCRRKIGGKRAVKKSIYCDVNADSCDLMDKDGLEEANASKSVTITIIDPSSDVHKAVSAANFDKDSGQTTFLVLPSSPGSSACSGGGSPVRDSDGFSVSTLQGIPMEFITGSDVENMADDSNFSSGVRMEDFYYTIEAAGDLSNSSVQGESETRDVRTIECFNSDVQHSHEPKLSGEVMADITRNSSVTEDLSSSLNFHNSSGRFTSNTAHDADQIMESASCIVCDKSISAGGKFMPMSSTKTSCTEKPVAALLGRVVGDSLSVFMSAGELVCDACFRLLELLDVLEYRLQNTTTLLLDRYWATAASRKLRRSRSSIDDDRGEDVHVKEDSDNSNHNNLDDRGLREDASAFSDIVLQKDSDNTMDDQWKIQRNSIKRNIFSNFDDISDLGNSYHTKNSQFESGDSATTGLSSVERRISSRECDAEEYLFDDIGSPQPRTPQQQADTSRWRHNTSSTAVQASAAAVAADRLKMLPGTKDHQTDLISSSGDGVGAGGGNKFKGMRMVKAVRAAAAKVDHKQETTVAGSAKGKVEGEGATGSTTGDHRWSRRKRGRPRKEKQEEEEGGTRAGKKRRRPASCQRVFLSPEMFKKCPQCPLIFLQHRRLQLHLERAHAHCRRDTACLMCSSSFSTYDSAVSKCDKCRRVERRRNLRKCLGGQRDVALKHELAAASTVKGAVPKRAQQQLRTLNMKQTKCDICSTECDTSTKLYRHFKLEHPELFPHGCDICSISFRSKTMLTKHLTMHVDGTLECPQCTLHFNKVYHFQEHLSSRHPDFVEFACSYCPSTVPSLDSFLSHLKVHHGAELGLLQSIPCPDCREQFHTGTALAVHRAAYHPSAATCPQCGLQTTASYLPVHINAVHTRAREHACLECGKMFYSRTGLTAHIKRHHKPLPLKCSLCGKGHVNAAELRRHLKGHKNQRDFKCDLCSRTFLKQADLTYHRRAHTGERPHVCPVCSDGFTRPGALKLHLEKHSQPRKNKRIKYSKSKIDELAGTSSITGIELNSVSVTSPAATGADSTSTSADATLRSSGINTQLLEMTVFPDEIPDFSREELVPFESDMQLSVVPELDQPLLEGDLADQLLLGTALLTGEEDEMGQEEEGHQGLPHEEREGDCEVQHMVLPQNQKHEILEEGQRYGRPQEGQRHELPQESQRHELPQEGQRHELPQEGLEEECLQPQVEQLGDRELPQDEQQQHPQQQVQMIFVQLVNQQETWEA